MWKWIGETHYALKIHDRFTLNTTSVLQLHEMFVTLHEEKAVESKYAKEKQPAALDYNSIFFFPDFPALNPILMYPIISCCALPLPM